MFENSPQIFKDIEKGLTSRVEHHVKNASALTQTSEMVLLGAFFNPYELNPLEAAVCCRQHSLVKILAKHIFPGLNDSLSVHIAAGLGDLEMLDILLEDRRVDPSALSNEALIWAIQAKQNQAAIRLLQDDRVKPEAWYNRALQIAASEGNTFMVGVLLSYDSVDPSSAKGLSMKWALEEGHNHIVVALHRNLKAKGQDPLAHLTAEEIQSVLAIMQSRDHQEAVIADIAPCFANGEASQVRIPPEVSTLIFSAAFNQESVNSFTDRREVEDLTLAFSQLNTDETKSKL